MICSGWLMTSIKGEIQGCRPPISSKMCFSVLIWSTHCKLSTKSLSIHFRATTVSSPSSTRLSRYTSLNVPLPTRSNKVLSNDMSNSRFNKLSPFLWRRFLTGRKRTENGTLRNEQTKNETWGWGSMNGHAFVLVRCFSLPSSLLFPLSCFLSLDYLYFFCSSCSILYKQR